MADLQCRLRVPTESGIGRISFWHSVAPNGDLFHLTCRPLRDVFDVLGPVMMGEARPRLPASSDECTETAHDERT
jgi:hypothetical protein